VSPTSREVVAVLAGTAGSMRPVDGAEITITLVSLYEGKPRDGPPAS
jgi:hypothetical protein